MFKSTNNTTLYDVSISVVGSEITLNGTATGTGTAALTGSIIDNILVGSIVSYSMETSDATIPYRCWLGYVDHNNSQHNSLSGMWETTQRTGNVVAQNKTMNSDAYKYRIGIGVVSGTNYNNFKIKLQVEKNSTATDYIAHAEQDFTLNLGSTELAKIGNYNDYIFHNIPASPYYDSSLVNGSWYKHSVIEKIVCDGVNYKATVVGPSGWFILRKSDEKVLVISRPNSTAICNRLLYNTASNISGSTTHQMGIGVDENGAVVIKFSNDDSTTNPWNANNINSYFQNNYFVFYTALKDSKIVNAEITDTTLISQLNAIENEAGYNGTTYITVTNQNNLAVIPNYHYNYVTPAPSPDRESEIEVVKGENTIEIANKNLFDENLILNATGWTKNDDGYYTGLAGRLNNYFNTHPISGIFKENTRYSLQWYGYAQNSNINERFNVIYADNTSENLAFLTTSEGLKTAVTAEGKTVSKIKFNYGNDGTVFIKNIQIEEGSTVSSYVPHQEQNYTISLPTGMELCKIEDYQDRIYGTPDNWFVEKQIGKVVFDGTENWIRLDSGNAFYINNVGVKPVATTGTLGQLISNYYKLDTYSHLYNANVDYGIAVHTTDRIMIRNKDILTVADFKTWLSTNNTIVYYRLAASTTTQITDTTLIQQLNDLYYANSYQGTTYITIDTLNKKPILKVDYKKSNLLRIKALENA